MCPKKILLGLVVFFSMCTLSFGQFSAANPTIALSGNYVNFRQAGILVYSNNSSRSVTLRFGASQTVNARNGATSGILRAISPSSLSLVGTSGGGFRIAGSEITIDPFSAVTIAVSVGVRFIIATGNVDITMTGTVFNGSSIFPSASGISNMVTLPEVPLGGGGDVPILQN